VVLVFVTARAGINSERAGAFLPMDSAAEGEVYPAKFPSESAIGCRPWNWETDGYQTN
jgi:hypothetical protein